MTRGSTPTVSVIVPTRNRPALLTEALLSISAQTAGDWEAVVVDDASDPPARPPESLSHRMRVTRHPYARGGAAAKNTGVRESRGEVLAFLDDDDLFAPAYISRALGVLDRHPDVEVVFMGVLWFGDRATGAQQAYRTSMEKMLAIARGHEMEDGALRFDERLVLALIQSVPMAFQRPVVRRDAFERIGGYRESCLLWDCDWAIRAALNGTAALVNEGLYLQRAQGQGYSSRPDRRMEHLQSGIEIREALLESTKESEILGHWQSVFREAVANSWFSLAYWLYLAGNYRESFAAWCQSQRYCFRPWQFKFLARLFLGVLHLARQADTEKR